MMNEPPAVSIVVPTYREASNLRALATRVFAATRQAGLEAELIIVDDNSQDGTEGIVAELAKEDYPVRVIVRTTDRGLSSAVLAGFAESKHELLLVLDADLQHPPEMIPSLIERLQEDDVDFVIGSRYGGEGEIVKDWPWYRRLTSWSATLMARPLTPLSDPMSGFFAISRSTWQRGRGLSPIGYKIALELYVKCGCRHAAEVPIRFDTRASGESKLRLAEQIRYLRHLSRLYRFRYPWLLPALVVLAVVVAVAIWKACAGTPQ